MLLDPSAALSEGHKTRQCAEQCGVLVGDINAILEELPALWEGVSANIFARNNQQLAAMLTSIQNELTQISEDIQTIASQP